ncbi:MAG: mRNA surveillance protein pelota [Candidatus ainarchaeum sp.]|nr:mRNA surveillance protein pelota [Candidatus ainarchaeum sp.]MDD5096788.1 mRNA surveillance protein pelota [Candidatus ainarchaeum sp.]
MRIVHRDLRNGELKLMLQRLEDLWHLERVLKEGDVVEARTYRSVKFGEGKEERKPVFITLRVESVEFAEAANRLRIGGIILAGNPEEFVQKGRHHTFDLESGDTIKVIKEWKNFEISRLEKAVKETSRPTLRIIVMDEEKALTAILRGYGLDYGPTMWFGGSKREDNYEEKLRQYYGEVASYISKADERFIVAGPGFAKDGLKDFIRKKYPDLLARITFESCSYAERSGIAELMKRGVVEKIVGEAQMEKEEKLFEEFMVRLHKDAGLAAYGKKEVAQAVDASAVETLLVLDDALRKDKEIERITENAESKRADIIFYSSKGDSAPKLKGFGGIAALLRFRIS